MNAFWPIVGSLALLGLAVAVALLLRTRAALARSRSEVAAEHERQIFYSTVLEHCDDVAFLYDIKAGRLSHVSASAQRQRGWSAAELTGKPLENLLPSMTLEHVREFLVRHHDPAGDEALQAMAMIEPDAPCRDGSRVAIETKLTLLRDKSGKPAFLLGVCRDISGRLERERDVRDAEERVRLALLCAGDSVWDIALDTASMNYAEGWQVLLGYDKSEMEPTLDGYMRLIHPEDSAKFRTELERHVQGETQDFICEFRVRSKDGGWRWVLCRGRLWSRTSGQAARHIIGTHTDITSRKVAEVAMSRTNTKLHSQIDEIRSLQTKLAEQAVRDPLTGLYNRRYLDGTLEREVARARREGHPLSVVMLDVDYFKRLNDSYGHQAGDEVLKALGELLRADTRTEDIPCRYGGEEFLVLLPSMPLATARERAERWRTQLEQHDFVFGNFPLSVTASFGVSSYPNHGKTPDELTRAADTALYNAKHNGRNRVELYEEAPIVFVTGGQRAAE